MVSFMVIAVWTPDLTMFLGVYKVFSTEFKVRPVLGYLDLMDETKWAVSRKSHLSQCFFFFCEYDKK
jgi:hypothetical protein